MAVYIAVDPFTAAGPYKNRPDFGVGAHYTYHDGPTGETEEEWWVDCEDEAFEEPVQCQGGIESIIDDVFYGQLPVPSLGGGVGYGATAVECWTLVRDQVPDGVDVPVSDAGVAPWTH